MFRMFPSQNLDVVGRLKTSAHQNIYEADFEYSSQLLRWETLVVGSGTSAQMPGQGGVQLSVTAANGDIVIRQSRPYHRYQPGKTMSMNSAVLFGTPDANNRQRVGYFDDSNGIFFEQAGPSAGNPFGIAAVVRSDVGGVPFDTRYDLTVWNGDSNTIQNLDFTRIQMVYLEYAWYGAGALRWGFVINGEPVIVHQVGYGNLVGQTVPWARTGNLPVRYETRNIGTLSAPNSFIHYGVSVLVEGRVDPQRGFTYSYGMDPATPRRNIGTNKTRTPVLSFRGRAMGTIEYTQATAAITGGTTTSLTASSASWTVNQWRGRSLNYVVSGANYTARITSNTATVLTLADVVTGGALANAPVAGQNYTIGLINRGQLLPQTLLVSADQVAVIEIIESSSTSPIVLTSPTFTAMTSLGSTYSFAERDVVATGMSGGEVVMAFTSPSGGSGLQQIDLSNLFPLYNTIKGNAPDILTLAITTGGTAVNVGAHFICQEAMS